MEDQDDFDVQEPNIQEYITEPNQYKNMPSKKYDFKEDSETSSIFESRIKITEKLVKINIINLDEIDMVARIINNKIWYNVVYDKNTESYIEHILKLISKM